MKFGLLCATLLLNVSLWAQSDSTAIHKEEAKRKIHSIRSEIISGNINFAMAARKYSMDPGSASEGGLYKNMPRGTFVPEFEAVAWSVKVNEVSEVFETQFGYHILLVDAKRAQDMDVRHILIALK